MKKAGILIIGVVFAFALVANVCAQTPPKPDKQQPGSTQAGSVVSMQGTTLTVTGGGKGGQTAFDTTTASWVGYTSPNDVKAGDNVNVTYAGTVDGLKKAIKVTKQGAGDIQGPKKTPTGGTTSR
jgi:hypothetical protein